LENNAIVSVTIEIELRHKNKNLGFGSICCCVDAGDFKCWLVDLRVTKSSNCEIGRERERARTRREREREADILPHVYCFVSHGLTNEQTHQTQEITFAKLVVATRAKL
jgi:hypothetical protein